MAFGALFILAFLPFYLVWPIFGATAQRFLRTERPRRTFSIAPEPGRSRGLDEGPLGAAQARP